MKKKNKAKNHQKRKALRTLKTRQKSKKKHTGSTVPRDVSYAVEHLANVSFKYLEDGVNFYFTRENVEGSLEDFITTKGKTYPNFSSGVRGALRSSNLEVSKPLTWIPESDYPLVRDYLAELWNPDLEKTRQLNSFTFFLSEDDDDSESLSEMDSIISDEDITSDEDDEDDVFESGEEVTLDEEVLTESEIENLVEESISLESEEEDEEEEMLLAASVISSGYSKNRIEAYLVIRRAFLKEGKISLGQNNIFLDLRDVFDLHVPPMIDLNKLQSDGGEESKDEQVHS
jgi:hypothetical protein